MEIIFSNKGNEIRRRETVGFCSSSRGIICMMAIIFSNKGLSLEGE